MNTATWVDPGYAKRLARQHEDMLRQPLELRTLRDLRASGYLLREQPGVKTGNGMKTGIRCWYLDPTTSATGLGIFTVDFDARSLRALRRSTLTPALIKITRHAHERMFERMRTNSWAEIRNALRILSLLPRPELIAEEADVETDHGTFHCVSEISESGRVELELVWVAKTFIAPKGARQ